MKKVLFWDFDGTLVRSDDLWKRCVYEALCHELPGHGLSREALTPHLATGFPWHDPSADYTACCRQAWWPRMNARFAHILEALGVEPGIARRAAMRVQGLVLSAHSYALYEDAHSTLRALTAAGWRHILLSNNYPELWQVAQALGLAPHFDGCVVSGKVGYEKPRRELFTHALERAGYPEVCVMIGDNPKADLAGALAMGMPCVLVHAIPHPEALFNAASLTEIPCALAQLA